MNRLVRSDTDSCYWNSIQLV